MHTHTQTDTLKTYCVLGEENIPSATSTRCCSGSPVVMFANPLNNARCTQARKTTHGLDGQHQDVDTTLRGSQSE